MIWSLGHSANVSSLSFKESKFLFLIVIATRAILTPLHPGLTPFGWRDYQNATKMSQICTKIDHFYVILMFAVTSYTVHSKMKICYIIHTTRHITLKCSLWENV